MDMSKAKFVARVWTKKQTQETIKALREAGYKINRVSIGYYESTMTTKKEGYHLFSAVIGGNGYLVRYDERLFG